LVVHWLLVEKNSRIQLTQVNKAVFPLEDAHLICVKFHPKPNLPF